MAGPLPGNLPRQKFAALLYFLVLGLIAVAVAAPQPRDAHATGRFTQPAAALQPAGRKLILNIAREAELGLLPAGAAAEAPEGPLVPALTKEQYDFLDECKKEDSSLKELTGYLSKGVPINLQDDRPNAGWDGRPDESGHTIGHTCLHFAVGFDNVALATFLLQRNADPNIQDSTGCTPLYLAVAMGHPGIAQVLLQNKANPNLVEETDSETPLCRAVASRYPGLAQLLLQYEADPNLATQGGWTPLDSATQKCDSLDECSAAKVIVSVLLKYGASKSSKAGKSVLCFLASGSQRDSLDILLSNRTKYGLTSEAISSALSCASSSDIVHALVDAEAEVNGAAVEKFAATGSWNIVGALLSRGAPMTSKVRQAAEMSTMMQPSFIAQSIVDKADANYTASHWAARFCDAYSLSLLVSTNTDTDMRAKDDATPFSIATDQQARCPGIHGMLNAFKTAKDNIAFAEANATELTAKYAAEKDNEEKAAAKDKADRKTRNSIVGAVAEGICFGSQLLNIFLINIDTIWKHSIFGQIMLPLISAAAAGVMYVAGWQTLGTVHSVAAGLELIAIAMIAYQGERVRHWLHGLKTWGETRKERVWLQFDCALHCFLGVFMLVGEVWSKGPERTVILAGVVDGIVAILSMTNVLPSRTVAVILGAAGIAWLALMVGSGVKGDLKLAIDGNKEDASPALIVLTSTWLLIACIQVPGAVTKTMDTVFDRVSGLELTVIPATLTSRGRFQASAFTMAEGAVAAIGLDAALGLSKEEINKGEELGVDAIRAEVYATKDVNDMQNLEYIIGGGPLPAEVASSLETGHYHGGTIGPDDFDTGHRHWPLSQWMQLPQVQLANLTEAELVAVRFYSSSSFWRINRPLRNLTTKKAKDLDARASSSNSGAGSAAKSTVPLPTSDLEATSAFSRLKSMMSWKIRKPTSDDAYDCDASFEAESNSLPMGSFAEASDTAEESDLATPQYCAQGDQKADGRHPWPMTVYFLDKGIKKLRAVAAQVDAEGFARQITLWRGMKDLTMDTKRFERLGGTELAPMSTTTDQEVARKYAQSRVPLVFKYEVVGIRTGVPIQWLSLYPKESEFLYPPLTYMSYRRHYEDDGQLIVVVEPAMS